MRPLRIVSPPGRGVRGVLAPALAVQQLAVDLVNYYSDVAVITETHFKSEHVDAVMNIPNAV